MNEGNSFNKSENIPFMSNNRAELYAIVQTLRRLPIGLKVIIFTDSKLAWENITVSNSFDFIKYESLDLIEELRYLISLQIEHGGSIKIEHVNSHLDSSFTPNYMDKLNKLRIIQ